MSEIREGDQVPKECESNTPEGVAAEIKGPEEVSIESGGMEVKVNAFEQTPVEPARDTGSVVESALTKTADASENGESDPSKLETTTAATEEVKIIQNSQAPIAAEKLEDKNQVQIAEARNTATTPPCLQGEDKMDITTTTSTTSATPEATEPNREKKRSRGEDAEQGHDEQENGNEAKRTKLDNGDAAANGHTANGQSQSANGDRKTNKEASLKKIAKRPSRLPKKVDLVDAPLQAQAVVAEPEETIARRTRSKA